MGNTQSAAPESERPDAIDRRARRTREVEARVTKHRPGHLYSHSIGIYPEPEGASGGASSKGDETGDPRPYAIVAASSFGRYGSSDVSLRNHSDQESQAGSDTTLIDTGSERSDSIHILQNNEVITSPDLEVKSASPSHPGTHTTPRPCHTEMARTPRAPSKYELPGAAMLSSHRASLILNEDALMSLSESPPQMKSVRAQEEEKGKPQGHTKIASLPSYLKIPTAIPRAHTSAKIKLSTGTSLLDVSDMSSSSRVHTDAPSKEGSPKRLTRTQTAPLLLSPMTIETNTVEQDQAHDMLTVEEPLPFTEEKPLTPVHLVWRGRGRHVYVTGTFADEWQSKIALRQLRPGTPFLCTLYLPPGTHRLKFVVDNRWRISPDLNTATDGDGTLVNYVEIPNLLEQTNEAELPGPIERDEAWAKAMADIKATQKEGGEWEIIGDEFPGTTETAWTRELPACVEVAQEAEERLLDSDISAEHSSLLPNPPQLPRQLEKVILNAAVTSDQVQLNAAAALVDDNSVLPAPNHAVLNHLATGSIKNGVLAMGMVTRYKNKYVTTVLYRPVQT
ncbi:unnamed protein product [Malassezia sympodialis ATCC 42132]|uniref:Similar to S.cerevisiae protein GAL83 (One of three possible beta-subunits of the Snf1 kinase complex) n=1 Tax=Malassezia sympodialis (strain ATCC 42132) TaxID=1230383 RepID=M5EBY6_MALS4|nr:uncharacterized protein MSY001_2818 [Malassezia sympodialis ATCC 42132]CCV00113.1 unnamed protein product [Malassezia sympodialis ATCC 42132]SHO80039.1 Similar to S.cerevisiae protein GAL83 (One of three possible beta-subunits of the Snf1 kinase complex) [Malassezia sympodialis ATCC 42132]|eukprot:XP_018741322.1 uncharacterized protein MSY001_2818 [Malassezia sympodialis ATCC 42132]